MAWNFLKFFTSTYWAEHFRTGFRSWRWFFVKISRVCVSAIRGFSEDDCASKASALTFYSLLSIVPVLAVAFGIAKGFGFEKHLEAELMQKLLDQRELADKLIGFAYTMLENTQSGLIAGVGLVVLFWSVFKLLGNIESSFNAIWRVKQQRSWSRRFSDYLAMMLFCPIFFAASSSLSVFIVTQIVNISKTNGIWETVAPWVLLSFHIFPLILSWVLFTAIYYIMPNTQVSLRYALLAGIIAGTIYQVVQWIYIQFQLGLASYGAIYGSFAALPLFLLWLNTSWLITLFGAEIAYHAENEMTFASYSHSQEYRPADARILGLLVMQQAMHAFAFSQPPPTIYNLAKHTGVAVFAMRHLISQLVDAGLLVEVFWRDGTGGHFQPGRNLKNITIKSVSDALDNSRHQYYMTIYNDEVKKYEKALADCDALLANAPLNYSVEDVPAVSSKEA